ncbi:MAG: prolyl oligopeptidase family serine peptidase, partial [Bacteroidales bacterium]|nr:prolyl oligopeptidase family serine peptidase [Bacteroidales bacterium]
FSVYYLAGVHGDLYDCFIAHAGIFDEKYMYYETEEMWFPNWDNGGLTEYSYTPGEIGPRGDGITFGGLQQGGSPWSNLPKAKRHYANSPDVNVANWHTPILCIHGMMDYRIPYDQGMAAFNAAQMMGVPSKLIVFPEECHWILKPQNALFWHREYFDWLERWCKE